MARRAAIAHQIDEELRVLAADVDDIQDMLEHPEAWTEANHQAAQWEWPEALARLAALVSRSEAGQLGPAQLRDLDLLVNRLEPKLPALKRRGLVIPEELNRR